MEVGDTAIAWDGEARTVNLTASEVTFVNASSQRVLTVPELAFSLDGKALLARQLRPKEITAHGVNLLLTRTEDGGFAMGLAHRTEDGGNPQRPLPEVVANLFGIGAAEEDALRRLRSVTLVDSRVRLVDQLRQRIYRMDGRLIRILSDGDHLAIQASVDLNARDLTVPLWLEIDYRPEGERAWGMVRFEGIRPPELVPALDAPEWLSGLDFPVSGEGRFAYSAADGPEPLKLSVESGEGAFDLAGVLPGPVPVRRLSFDGAFDIGPRRILMDHVTYDSGAFIAEAEGEVRFRDIGPDLDVSITGEDVPAELLGDYWPPTLEAGVRSWLIDHVRAGTATAVSADLNIDAEMWQLTQSPDEAFRVDITFRDAEVKLYPPFDPVTDGAGRLSVTGQSFDLALSEGRLGDLSLSEGHVSIAEFAAHPPVLVSEFVTRGSIPETVAAVLRGSVGGSLEGAQQLFGVGGSAATRIRLSLPIHSGVSLTDTDFVATANLTDVVADGLWGDLPLRADALEVNVDREGAAITGRVNSDGSWFDINWIERFGAAAGIRREIAFSGEAESVMLEAEGIVPPARLGGRLRLEGRLRADAGGIVDASVRADLTKSLIALEEIDWRKPAGVPARIEFDYGSAAGDDMALRGLVYEGGGLELAGSVVLDAAGVPLRTDLDRLRFGNTDVALTLAELEDGSWRAVIRGPRLDLSQWLEGEDGEPMSLDALEGATIDTEVAELVVRDGTRFDGFAGSLRIEGGMPVGRAAGRLNGRADMTLETAQGSGGWTFDLEAADAGEVLAAARITNALLGGSLNIEGTATGPASASGVARIEDFTLRETPGFARLLSLASFTGIAEALSGRGLSFTQAELLFDLEDGRISITRGRMVGPSVGLTTEGYYVPETEEIRLVGNLIPAYSISSVLGAIPLLGEILGGDQGLFGVTYVVSGSAGDPEVSVNPLSVLAPGILRRMFLAPVDPSDEPAAAVPGEAPL